MRQRSGGDAGGEEGSAAEGGRHRFLNCVIPDAQLRIAGALLQGAEQPDVADCFSRFKTTRCAFANT
jgi:hypothetical protein